MKVLLLTVAGLSSRFEQSLGRPCLKCIYFERSFTQSLLYRMVGQSVEFDRYVVVGGYRFGELQKAVARYFPDKRKRIILVENDRYANYGSGYSLDLGLREAIKLGADEIVFAEGDLYVDQESFQKVCCAPTNVLTSNCEPILAKNSVAFYYDENGQIHYIYDTGHCALQIDGLFTAVFNSGQIWKFSDLERVRRIYDDMDDRERQGTNLAFIQRYFQQLDQDEYENVRFQTWINCNTVNDFRKSIGCI